VTSGGHGSSGVQSCESLEPPIPDSVRDASALQELLREAARFEVVPPALAAKIARAHARTGDLREAAEWTARVVEGGYDYVAWSSVAALVKSLPAEYWPRQYRRTRVAIAGSYTTGQFSALLRLACMQLGIEAAVFETPFAQYRQELLDTDSDLYRFEPNFIIVAVHVLETALPDYHDDPARCVAAEVERWRALWDIAGDRAGARVVQHNFAIPAEEALNHLSARIAGSRYSMLQTLNRALADAAGTSVSIVDCERLAAGTGKATWFDQKYWHVSKQAVSLRALPLLAHHTAAVIAAELGLTRKCVVLDLDNTLWGGVVGEDGIAGIRIGSGPDGEAFSQFQHYLLRLKQQGVLLAVCSKNNPRDAMEPFEQHPDMVLRPGDFVAFVANWNDKVSGMQEIARILNIGLDSLVFVDDNPVERQAVRRTLPDVDVITLPAEPERYMETLAAYPMLERSWITSEDRARTDVYRARAEAAAAREAARTPEEYYRELCMTAVLGRFDAIHLPRIAQLFGKTNQFNMTTRRHSLEDLQRMAADPHCIHFWLKLRDRYADHGLVSAMIARAEGGVVDIESWIMSCRVIGRTVESVMLRHLAREAKRRGCERIRGTWIETPKNEVARDVYERYGFELEERQGAATSWIVSTERCGHIQDSFIQATVTNDN
jgi:FkbH-like protein